MKVDGANSIHSKAADSQANAYVGNVNISDS
jgi:hypothetical protein